MKVVLSYGIEVDKDELIKTLAYDREQYEKGYADGLKKERTAKVMSIVLTSNPPQHVLICGNCGRSIDKTDWKYCPNCSARLERNYE